MKKRSQVNGSLSSFSLPNSKASTTVKTKKTSDQKENSNISSLSKLYRLPSSLKRTQDMINKSILQQHLSSRILDLVGNTFRIKNAIQPELFPSNIQQKSNVQKPPRYKGNNNSYFLETLYEEEGEDEDEENKNNSQMNTTTQLSTSFAEYHDKRSLLNSSLCLQQKRSNSSSSRSLQRMNNSSKSSVNLQQKHKHSKGESILYHGWEQERTSLSPKPQRNDLSLQTWKPDTKPFKQKKVALADIVNNKMTILKDKKMIINDKRSSPEKTQSREKVEIERGIHYLEARIKKLKEDENNTVKNSLRLRERETNLTVQNILQQRDHQEMIEQTLIGEKSAEKKNACKENLESCFEAKKLRNSQQSPEKEALKEKDVMKFSIYKSLLDFDKKFNERRMSKSNSSKKSFEAIPCDVNTEEIDNAQNECRIRKVNYF